MNALNILLIIGGVGFILVRRMLGELVELKKLMILPLVLSGIGASQLGHTSGTTAAILTVSVALSVALGALRGVTVHLGARNGQLWMRYRIGTVALWVANLAAKGALVGVAHVVAPHAAASKGILFSLGLGILAETLVIAGRALHSDAAVVWVKGEHGRPDATSDRFEQLRGRVRSGSGSLTQTARTSFTKRDW